MDFHKIEGITIEDVKNAHLADVSVQDKYGVRYHQFWVNQQAGTIFCLMEGPDKESCESVHREAHGQIACAIEEVEPGFYELMMGKGQTIDSGGLVTEPDGTPDLGFRSVMVVNIYGATSVAKPQDYQSLVSPQQARELVSKKASEFHGHQIEGTRDDSITRVFHSASNALRCAREIQTALTMENSGAG